MHISITEIMTSKDTTVKKLQVKLLVKEEKDQDGWKNVREGLGRERGNPLC